MKNLTLNQAFLVLINVLLLFFLLTESVHGQTTFNARKTAYIDAVIDQNNMSGKIFKAYRDVPLTVQDVAIHLEGLDDIDTVDFQITEIIRLLFLTEGQFDVQILDALDEIPLWLPDIKGNIRQYWSENHMIMYMSAHWLLHESYGREDRNTLEQMLNHYLDTKNTYGFYEFLSPIYARYTMSALLNLADFSKDETIKQKAANAARKLIRQILQVVNDEGTFFPAAGRAFYNAYDREGRLRPTIYLLTGLGELTDDTEISSVFFATTSINLSLVLNEWRAIRNITLHSGHTIDDGYTIHGNLERQDRGIFQWSAGGYFHPDLAADFKWTLDYYDLWSHEAFEDYAQYQSLPTAGFIAAAEVTAAISRSSYIGESEVKIFKNNGIVLTSIQDHWKGRLGSQQWPWVATVGKEAVFTRSGNPGTSSSISNTTLPYVKQEDNVALIMYRANKDLLLFGFDNFDVALYWQEEDFDQVRRSGNWIIAREAENYIAVRKHCNQTINGYEACNDQDGQTWAVVVGNDQTHGTFNQFQDVIEASTYEERWIYNWVNGGYTYHGEINVDGKRIYHRWAEGAFKTAFTEKETIELETENIIVYPNPASDQFEIKTNEDFGQINKISVVNNIGQVVYENTYEDSLSTIVVNSDHWKSGVYFMSVNSGKRIKTFQIVIN